MFLFFVEIGCGEKKMKKKYLIRGVFCGIIIGFYLSLILIVKKMIKQKNRIDKLQEFYDLLIQWLKNTECKKHLADFFYDNKFNSVAIYGIKEIGELLYNDLTSSGITVKYIVDKNVKRTDLGVPVISPNEDLQDVDVIVVTAIHYFDEIRTELEKKVSCNIVSIEDIIYGNDYWYMNQ